MEPVRYVLPVVTSVESDGTRNSRVLCPRTGEETSLQKCGQCPRCLGLMLNVSGLGTVLKCTWGDGGSVVGAGQPLSDGPTIAELMTPAPCVDDVMTHSVLGLASDASVARAAALMAYEGVHQLVVLNATGGIEGVISSLDILHWFATTSGFALPRRGSSRIE